MKAEDRRKRECLGTLEWTELTAGIQEGKVVAMFKVMIKGEPGVGELEKLLQVGLVDEGEAPMPLINVQNHYWPWKRNGSPSWYLRGIRAG